MGRLVDDIIAKNDVDSSLVELGRIIFRAIEAGMTTMEMPTRLFHEIQMDDRPIEELSIGHNVYLVRTPDGWDAVIRITDKIDCAEEKRLSLVDTRSKT